VADRVVVICGSGPVELAVASRLAAAGTTVVVAATDAEAAGPVVAAVEAAGGRPAFFGLTGPDDAGALAEFVAEQFGS
jgi:NAD(P)-dependent dehydrogenase (short-subunit alcohol dehydrogenase family)